MTNQKQDPPVESPSVTLERLFSPQLANALRVVKETLPYDDQAVAAAYLTGVSGVLGLGTKVRANPRGRYAPPANLYMAIVADSGDLKSPLLVNFVKDPASNVIRMIEKENEALDLEWQMKNMGVKKSEQDPRPVHARAHEESFTAAALEQQMQVHEERGLGKLIFEDELSSLFDSFRKSDKRQQHMLKLYDGSGLSSNVATGLARVSKTSHVSVCGGIQPNVFRSYIKKGDPYGSWARFLYCPLPGVAQRLPDKSTPEEIAADEEAREILKAYVTRVHTLAPRTYTLGDDAIKLFNDYHYHAQKVKGDFHLSGQRALCGKKAGKVLRVAGLLHILRHVGPGSIPELIDLDTLQQAIIFVDELDSWIHSFYSVVDEAKKSGVSDLMRKIHDVAVKAGEPVSWGTIQGKMSKSEREGATRDIAAEAMEKLVGMGLGDFVPGKQKRSLLYQAKS